VAKVFKVFEIIGEMSRRYLMLVLRWVDINLKEW